MNFKWLIYIVFFYTFSCFADNAQYRMELSARVSLSDRLSSSNSIGLTHYDYFLAKGNRFQLRTNYSYSIGEASGITGGLFFHFIDHQHQDEIVELRPWLGYKMALKPLNWFKIEQNLRYEYRANFPLGSEDDSYATNVFRYKIQFLVPVYHNSDKEKKLNMVFGPEFFVGSSSETGNFDYNRLRTALGADFQMNENWRTSVSVVPEFSQSNQISLTDLNAVIFKVGIKRYINAN